MCVGGYYFTGQIALQRVHVREIKAVVLKFRHSLLLQAAGEVTDMRLSVFASSLLGTHRHPFRSGVYTNCSLAV